MIGGQTRESIARSYERGGNKALRTDPIGFGLVLIYLISITALHFRFRFQLTALPVLCAHREILVILLDTLHRLKNSHHPLVASSLLT
jgi:hypothetical protein